MKRYSEKSSVELAINEYNHSGGFVFENFISDKVVSMINSYLDAKGSTYTQLYFDLPWGYGNIKEEDCCSPVINHPWMSSFFTALFGAGFDINHLVCNEKSPFFGYEVEWHQEVSNIATFGPGTSPDEAELYFAQVFIALDDQGEDNGGLMVMPGSNRLGVLEVTDVLSPALSHKSSVSLNGMKLANDTCQTLCPTLRPGDALIFSPFLIHSSLRNVSSERRRSLVMQARSERAPNRDDSVYEREIQRRTDFAVEQLSHQIEKLEKTNLYRELARRRNA